MFAWPRLVGRVVGCVGVAAFAAFELRRYGLPAAAAGAYLVFVLAQVAVGAWAALQYRRTRRRLDELRGLAGESRRSRQR